MGLGSLYSVIKELKIINGVGKRFFVCNQHIYIYIYIVLFNYMTKMIRMVFIALFYYLQQQPTLSSLSGHDRNK